jgi:Nucleotide-diphospho-sugar transferase
MRPRLFGTLFYANYLTRALALYRSLGTHFAQPFTLLALCMDDLSADILRDLDLPNLRILRIGELEARYPELAVVKPSRSIGEYSWTCTPAFMRFMLTEVGAGEAIAYLDADLMFFSDVQPVFDEWGENDILIHEHRYAPRHRDMIPTSGIFNVGLVAIRHTSQGINCLERWYEQCIALCTLDGTRGLCGDQGYLDEWPALYDRLTILRHKGAGLAPWNLEQYELSRKAGYTYVDGAPLIFYHYHAFRWLGACLGRGLVVPSLGYDFTPSQLQLIYRPYVAALAAAERSVRLTRLGAELPRTRIGSDEKSTWRRWRLFATKALS